MVGYREKPHATNMDMTYAVIEGKEGIDKMLRTSKLYPFRCQFGEMLPSNVEMNLSGVLVSKDVILYKVDIGQFLVCTELLKDQLLIAKFINSEARPHIMEIWLKALNERTQR